MSLDAVYILYYSDNREIFMEEDIKYLKEEYGGHFETLTGGSIFWIKPKHTLADHELEILQADQILERKDFESWEIIK